MSIDLRAKMTVGGNEDSFNFVIAAPAKESKDTSPGVLTSVQNTFDSIDLSGRVLSWTHSNEKFRISSHSITDFRELIPVLEGNFRDFSGDWCQCPI